MNNKIFCQVENLKAAIFIDSASDAVQNVAVCEGVPDDLKKVLRGADEVLNGLRELFCELSEKIEALPSDTVEGEELAEG